VKRQWLDELIRSLAFVNPVVGGDLSPTLLAVLSRNRIGIGV